MINILMKSSYQEIGIGTGQNFTLEKIETIPESNISINLNNYIIETVLIKENMIKFAKVSKISIGENEE